MKLPHYGNNKTHHPCGDNLQKINYTQILANFAADSGTSFSCSDTTSKKIWLTLSACPGPTWYSPREIHSGHRLPSGKSRPYRAQAETQNQSLIANSFIVVGSELSILVQNVRLPSIACSVLQPRLDQRQTFSTGQKARSLVESAQSISSRQARRPG